jgi:hypothetical protein
LIDDETLYRAKRFRFSRDFRHALGQATVPVVASELFSAAHELPLLFARSDQAWTVVGVVADASLRRPLIAPTGAWDGDYAPLLLRIHPFRRSADDTSWEIDPVGLVDAPQPGKRFLEGGRPTPDFLRVIAVLNEADAGRATLARCASALEDAGLLVPLATGFDLPRLSPTLASLFCVDAPRLARSPAAKLGSLAEGTPAPLEVAIASIYSLRHLDGRFATGEGSDLESRMATLIQRSAAAAPAATEAVPPQDALKRKSARKAEGFSLDASITLDFSNLF